MLSIKGLGWLNINSNNKITEFSKLNSVTTKATQSINHDITPQPLCYMLSNWFWGNFFPFICFDTLFSQQENFFLILNLFL